MPGLIQGLLQLKYLCASSQLGVRESTRQLPCSADPLQLHTILVPILRQTERERTLTERVLCMQGGSVIQQLRDTTGARIKVEPEVSGCSERLIALSSPDEPGADLCRAQEALFAVQDRMTEADSGQEGSCCTVSVCCWHVAALEHA